MCAPGHVGVASQPSMLSKAQSAQPDVWAVRSTQVRPSPTGPDRSAGLAGYAGWRRHTALRPLHAPPSSLRPPPTAHRPPPSALRPPPSALRPPPSALRPPPSALRPPPSALRPPPSACSALCPPPIPRCRPSCYVAAWSAPRYT